VAVVPVASERRFAFSPGPFIESSIFAATVLVPIGVRWGRYKRSASTRPCSEVIAPLVASAKEFCLVLRPFGGDGEIVLPHRMFGAWRPMRSWTRSGGWLRLAPSS
jgi:hypothetical protein